MYMMNRRSIFTALLLLSAGLAAAQTAAPAPVVASPPQTFTKPAGQLPNPPARTTVPDGTRYLNNPGLLVFSTNQVAQFNDHDADILFLGDSITQGWLGKGKEVWDANFAPRNALDFGISGDGTQHVLWRMENYPIARLHPKLAIVLIGTNNTGSTPQEIADGVRAVLTKTQTLYPGIRIILNSIMPNKRANDKMMAANAILRGFADGKTIFYLDLIPVMTPVGDNWKGLGSDHLHPDAAGYQLWADALMPLVNKVLPGK
jgi:lysophospholipase L1-like esterase